MYFAQSKSFDKDFRKETIKLTERIESIVEFARQEAAETDSVESFPEKTLQKIIESGLLTAFFPKENGGFGLGTESGTQSELLNILKILGRANLVIGRVVEGHFNAVLLTKFFGASEQLNNFAEIIRTENAVSGVWNTEAANGVTIGKSKKGAFQMSGWKTFATGVDFVEYPIVNGELKGKGWQMCLVPLKKFQVETDASWWSPMGMKATRSFRVCFDDVELSADDLIGAANDYYRQPLFSGGAIRFAAVQLGGAEAIFDETRQYLQKLERTEDVFQQMRIGKMAIEIEAGNLWLGVAAEKFEKYLSNPCEKTSEEFLNYANMMRTAIGEICRKTIVLCEESVGARGLNQPFHFGRIIRDLSIYLRQPAPDAALLSVGEFAFSQLKAK